MICAVSAESRIKDFKLDKQKILIVDDSEMNRELLIDMLDDAYDTVEAEDGEQAVEILKKHPNEFTLMLLDIMMPKMNGFEVLNYMNETDLINSVAVIMISSDDSRAKMEHAYAMGAFDYISRPFDTVTVKRRIYNTILVYAKTRNLEKMLAERVHRHEKDNKLMISMLAQIMEFRNGESKLHILHTNNITRLLLERIVQKTDKYNLTWNDIELISTASSLHDIGKVSIPEIILNKPGKLTKEEFETMKTHAKNGANLLKKLPFKKNINPILHVSHDVCLWHHKRFDGRGYPDGLKGDQIPIAAQAVGMADVYDALTSERCYKSAYTHEEAVKMILNDECGVFNPMLLGCLEDISDKLKININNAFFDDEESDEKNRETIHYHEDDLSNHDILSTQAYHFLAEQSRDIVFTYNAKPPSLSFNRNAQTQWGSLTYIDDPSNSKTLKSLVSKEDFDKLKALINAASPDDPEITADVVIKGKKYEVRAQVIFKNGLGHNMRGIVGKCISE